MASRGVVAVVMGLVVALVVAAKLHRVEVQGQSMAPTLEAGDRLVVMGVPGWWPLGTGQVVAVPDPRPGTERLLIKRVQRVGPGWVEVRGDNVAASTDSRVLGRLARRAVVGPALYRYWPTERAGRLTRPPSAGG